MARKTIDNSRVINVWKGNREDDNGKDESYETEVTPDWYQDNGTPIDEMGEDMTYVRTEIVGEFTSVEKMTIEI